MIMKEVHVTAAVIVNDGKILCVQRGENKLSYISKKWEFPGGKVEVGEALEDTIKREIAEELHLQISVREFLIQVNHEYPDFKLKMDTFICEIIDGELKLTEHIDFKWLNKEELSAFDWAAADVPIVEKLLINE
jgi:8-oxo-dGTP diphosphatase